MTSCSSCCDCPAAASAAACAAASTVVKLSSYGRLRTAADPQDALFRCPLQQGSASHEPRNALASGQSCIPSSEQPPAAAAATADTLSRTNLYIRGLSPNTTEEDLFNLCRRFGKILSTKVINDPINNKCKGYGFVDFEEEQTADAALVTLQNQGIQVQMARCQEQDPSNLYFSNLPPFFTELELETLLSPFGGVISTRVLRHLSGISRRIGFARMETKEQCEAIIHAFNGRIINDSRIPLIVKFADSRNRKKVPFSLQHQMIAVKYYDNSLTVGNNCNTSVRMAMVTPRCDGTAMAPFPDSSSYAPAKFMSAVGCPVFPGSWYHHQSSPHYLMPVAVTPIDSEIIHLTSGLGNLHLAGSFESDGQAG